MIPFKCKKCQTSLQQSPVSQQKLKNKVFLSPLISHRKLSRKEINKIVENPTKGVNPLSQVRIKKPKDTPKSVEKKSDRVIHKVKQPFGGDF